MYKLYNQTIAFLKSVVIRSCNINKKLPVFLWNASKNKQLDTDRQIDTFIFMGITWVLQNNRQRITNSLILLKNTIIC